MKHPHLGRLCLLLVGVFVPLALGEITLRVLAWPSYSHRLVDPVLGYRFIPNSFGMHFDERCTFYRINSHGFRDKEYPVAKPAGVFRIAVLGDSYAQALQAPLDKTFHKQLEKQLNVTAAGQPVFEVMSFGVSGYSTAQELLLFRQEVLRFKPDLVLLGFCWYTDVSDNSKELGYWFRPFLEWNDGRLTVDNSFVERHKHHGKAALTQPRSWLRAFWQDQVKAKSKLAAYLYKHFRTSVIACAKRRRPGQRWRLRIRTCGESSFPARRRSGRGLGISPSGSWRSCGTNAKPAAFRW